MSHYKEPWSYRHGSGIISTSPDFDRADQEHRHIGLVLSDKYARRILLCVNALAEFSTEDSRRGLNIKTAFKTREMTMTDTKILILTIRKRVVARTDREFNRKKIRIVDSLEKRGFSIIVEHQNEDS